MRTTLAALTTLVLLTITTAAEDATGKFFTSSDGLKIHDFELGTAGTPVILIHGYTAIFGGSGPQETDPAIIAQVPKDVAAPAATDPNAPRGENWSSSAHLDPGYTPALVTFIDAHDR